MSTTLHAPAVDYPSYSQARTHLKDVLDATDSGRTITMARDGRVAIVLPAEKLRAHFAATIAPRLAITKEADSIVAFMEDRPFVSEGATLPEALDDLILTLREYAEDWEARLQHAPNHADNWALVQLVKTSNNTQLLDWFNNGGK